MHLLDAPGGKKKMSSQALAPNRLLRVSDGVVAGVAGGLARRLGVSAWVVRLVWLGAVLFGGTGVVAYAILWWVMPHEARVPLEPTIWVRGRGGHHPPLYRTNVDRKLFGVCGGIARRLEVDPTMVRLAAMSLVALSAGFAVVVYLVAALVIPGPEAELSSSTVEL
jgi:phage shock protein PspC (stress-responsive transcriptional regulator)